MARETADPYGSPRSRRPTARHESGHAVCAWSLGLTVELITLHSNSDGANGISFAEFNEESTALKALLITTYAGAEAEHMVSRRNRKTPEAVFARSTDKLAAIRILRRLLELVPLEIADLVSSAPTAARERVRRFRPAIEALTDELSVRRWKIEGDAARELAFAACPELAEAYRLADGGLVPAAAKPKDEPNGT